MYLRSWHRFSYKALGSLLWIYIYIEILDDTLNFVVIELYFVTSENWPMSTLRNRIPVTCFFLRSEIQDLSPTRD